MTILGRWIRNLVERWLDRYHEGPRCPPRFGQEVRMFWTLNPLATAEEWERFTLDLVRRGYQDGFTRGFEWCERSWEGPAVDPERLLEEQRHAELAVTDPRWLELMRDAPRRQREAAAMRELHDGLLKAGRVPWRLPGRREG